MALADLFEEGLGPVRDQWPPEGRGEGGHRSRVTKHGHEIAVGPFADLGAKGSVDSVKRRLRPGPQVEPLLPPTTILQRGGIAFPRARGGSGAPHPDPTTRAASPPNEKRVAGVGVSRPATL
jgi:hypothetical protein